MTPTTNCKFLELDTTNTVKLEVPKSVELYVEDFLKDHLLRYAKKNGTYDQQKKGFISELVTHHYLLGKYKKLQTNFDDGIDLVYKGFNIDVKTSTRLSFIRPNYSALYMARAMAYKTDIVIFNNYNTTEDIVEICGWIFSKDIERYARRIEENSVRKLDGNKTMISKFDNYDLNYSLLNSIEILENL